MFGSRDLDGFGSVLEMVLPKGTAIHLRTTNDCGMLSLLVFRCCCAVFQDLNFGSEKTM